MLNRPHVQLREEPETTNEVVREREALEELIQTPGWRIFLAHAAQEWEGRGYRQRIKTALASMDPLSARVVDRTADEIFRLLKWPEAQINDLKGVVDE